LQRSKAWAVRVAMFGCAVRVLIFESNAERVNYRAERVNCRAERVNCRAERVNCCGCLQERAIGESGLNEFARCLPRSLPLPHRTVALKG
jgi:hypothetical protein